MLQISRIELREIRLPLKEPFQISSGSVHERRIVLIKVVDSDSCEGWGECVAGEFPNYSPEGIDTAWTAIAHWIAPRVLGNRFGTAREVFPLLEEDFRGNLMAKAAVEMACWELEARKTGIPLSRLLGGTRESVEVGISLGIQDSPERLVEKTRAAFNEGYRKVKIKVKPGRDVTFVREVCDDVGSGARLMADANNAYTLDDIETLRALDELGLMMIEQPLAWDDLVRHAELQRQMKTPICLDESITSLARAEDMVKLGAGRIVNIKPGRVGGFTASLAIHNFCQAHNIPVWCGGMLESGVGRGHNVALASLPNFRLPGDVSPSRRYWQRDIVTPEWTMDEQGRVQVPLNRAGIGVEVDRDRLEDLTVKREVLQ